MPSFVRYKIIFFHICFFLSALSSSAFSAEPRHNIESKKYADAYQVTAHNSFFHYGDMGELLKKVNSIEYDVHPSSAWAVYHNDDDYGSTQCHHSLNVCLKGVRTYHDQNPNHPPITIFIEIKNSKGFRVPDFNGIFCGPERNSTKGGRNADDAVFRCDELYRPRDLKGTYDSLRNASNANAWPTLENLKGKIIFVVNGVPDALGKYMRETNISKNGNADNENRDEASAFVMVDNVINVNSIKSLCHVALKLKKTGPSCDNKSEYYDQLSANYGSQNGIKTKKKIQLLDNVVFFNAPCSKWINEPKLGAYIRLKNYVSRGYTCDYQDAPLKAVNNLVLPTKLNFVAYDKIENAFPQGNFTQSIPVIRKQ